MNSERVNRLKQEIRQSLIEKGIIVNEDRLEKLFDSAINDYEIEQEHEEHANFLITFHF